MSFGMFLRRCRSKIERLDFLLELQLFFSLSLEIILETRAESTSLII